MEKKVAVDKAFYGTPAVYAGNSCSIVYVPCTDICTVTDIVCGISDVICTIADQCNAHDGCSYHPCSYTPCSDSCSDSCSDTPPPTTYGSITSITATSDSITIEYTEITNATSYQIAYRKTSESNAQTIDGVTKLRCTITGLSPDTEYVVNYRGVAGSTDGQFMPTGKTIRTEPLVVRPDRWDWSASNGSATAAETRLAHEVVTSRGPLSNFSHKVWNDLVDKVNETTEAVGDEWNVMYATLAQTKMTSSDKALTAQRFNALRQNIGRKVSTGIAEVFRGDVVYGSYFITLTEKLNDWIDSI